MLAKICDAHDADVMMIQKGKRKGVGGPLREKQKREEGGCKRQGVGKQNCQGENQGNPRV